MSWLQRLQSEASIRLTETGLPRRVLRHLIVSHDIGVGSRVLDVGCGSGELVRFLNELGIKAAGISASANQLRLADASAGLDFFDWSDLSRLAEEGCSFDLAIVRESIDHAEDLFTPAAFDATARLIDVLRPGGSLAFVQSDARLAAPRRLHAPSCFSRHLCMFPGSCKTAEFPAASGQIDAIRRMFARNEEHVIAATFRRPLDSSTHYEWRAIARVAAESHRERCCLGVAAADSSSRQNRRAA